MHSQGANSGGKRQQAAASAISSPFNPGFNDPKRLERGSSNDLSLAACAGGMVLLHVVQEGGHNKQFLYHAQCGAEVGALVDDLATVR